MNATQSQPKVGKNKRAPLSVWELPKLLKSVHQYRKSKPKKIRERPHYKAILAFIHRNRFAVCSQVQRRFVKYLPSDRTARRHLAEMEALGLLDVVETSNVSPLWPKVYFVTSRGLACLKKGLLEQGHQWSETLQDRRRLEGVSAQHVLHEVLTTEFLLLTWDAAQARDDLEILTMQRRSLAKHESFEVVVGGRPTRLRPDGMFLYQQQGNGMIACFLEVDLDSMSPKQMAAKFKRYHTWAESHSGVSYLKALYLRHGATAPTAAFRILLVVGSRSPKTEKCRLARLIQLASRLPNSVRNRIWLTTVSDIQTKGAPSPLFMGPIWRRVRDGSFSQASCHRLLSLPCHSDSRPESPPEFD